MAGRRRSSIAWGLLAGCGGVFSVLVWLGGKRWGLWLTDESLRLAADEQTARRDRAIQRSGEPKNFLAFWWRGLSASMRIAAIVGFVGIAWLTVSVLRGDAEGYSDFDRRELLTECRAMPGALPVSFNCIGLVAQYEEQGCTVVEAAERITVFARVLRNLRPEAGEAAMRVELEIAVNARDRSCDSG